MSYNFRTHQTKHCWLLMIKLPCLSESVRSQLCSLFFTQFFNNTAYVLGGSPFTLQDIENGVLRANKKGVGALSPQFSKVDPRRRLSLDQAEPRIHFALNCGAKSCPPIKTFSAQVGLREHRDTLFIQEGGTGGVGFSCSAVLC